MPRYAIIISMLVLAGLCAGCVNSLSRKTPMLELHTRSMELEPGTEKEAGK